MDLDFIYIKRTAIKFFMSKKAQNVRIFLITLWISIVKSELCPANSLQALEAPLQALGKLQILGALFRTLGAALLQTSSSGFFRESVKLLQ